MPKFEYVIQQRKGAPYIRAFADAPTLADVNIRLTNLNRPVVRVIEKNRVNIRRQIRIALRDKLLFIEQLEACVYLGVDFRTALSICLDTASRRTKSARRMVEVITQLREEVSRGTSFSQAITRFPHIFGDVARGILAAVEEGGTFAESLTNVRQIWSRNEELQHRLKMMMIYPAIVLCTAFGVVGLLMMKVVPQFLGVMAEMQVQLPLPTRILLTFSNFCIAYPWISILLILTTLCLFVRIPAIIRALPISHRVILKVPIVGQLLLQLMRANFARTFAQLKRAGARTTYALLLCRDLSWNYAYRSAIARSLVRVQNGIPLSNALADKREIFGEMIVSSLTFMETSGADSRGLFRLTNLLERQLDALLLGIRQVLDPILIIFLGLLVGGIVFATFLPAIEIMQKI